MLARLQICCSALACSILQAPKILDDELASQVVEPIQFTGPTGRIISYISDPAVLVWTMKTHIRICVALRTINLWRAICCDLPITGFGAAVGCLFVKMVAFSRLNKQAIWGIRDNDVNLATNAGGDAEV